MWFSVTNLYLYTDVRFGWRGHVCECCFFQILPGRRTLWSTTTLLYEFPDYLANACVDVSFFKITRKTKFVLNGESY